MKPFSRISPTLLKYALLQIPELALLATVLLLIDHWYPLPGWVFWGILGLWLAKDMALYPLVRKAYAPHDPATSDPLIGARGTVRQRLAPAGYILVHGQLWQAELTDPDQPAEPGTAVQVSGLRGLTLLVAPLKEAHPDRKDQPAGPHSPSPDNKP